MRLALCGLLALIVSEVVWTGFLDSPFHRQDTVFKFGLQAWYLLGTAAACAALNQRGVFRWMLPVRVLFFVLICTALRSSWLVVQARAQNFSQWQGFDSWLYLAPPERAAAQWLMEKARDGDAIFEAEKREGGDYSEYSRYAHATGIPAVIGPQAHSFQWVGNWEEVFSRKKETRDLFTSPDLSARSDALRKYAVRWIVLGELERKEYGEASIARLEKSLPVAARFGTPTDLHRVVICNNPLRDE